MGGRGAAWCLHGRQHALRRREVLGHLRAQLVAVRAAGARGGGDGRVRERVDGVVVHRRDVRDEELLGVGETCGKSAGPGLTPATSALGLGSTCHICTSTGLTPATSALDWVRPRHIGTGTGLTDDGALHVAC